MLVDKISFVSLTIVKSLFNIVQDKAYQSSSLVSKSLPIDWLTGCKLLIVIITTFHFVSALS